MMSGIWLPLVTPFDNVKAGLALSELGTKETRLPITEASATLTRALECALARLAQTCSHPISAIERIR